jgi:hypothetical protein
MEGRLMDEKTAKEIMRKARELTIRLMDEGKLIQGGWEGYKMQLDPRAGAVQVEETRIAFYAGAHHVFQSIMTAMDPGKEPTEQDMARIALIQAELDEFIAAYRKKHGL